MTFTHGEESLLWVGENLAKHLFLQLYSLMSRFFANLYHKLNLVGDID